MKKIFLIASIIVASTLHTLAYKAGDYVYTRNGRYKLTTAVNLLPNGNFANFGVYEATKVSDDREVNALIAGIDALLANPLFSAERETLIGVREALQTALSNESSEEVDALIEAVRQEGITAFLDANTLNVTIIFVLRSENSM